MAIYRSVFSGNLPNGDTWNMGLGSASDAGITAVQLVATTFMTQWKSFIQPLSSPDFSFEEVTTYQLDPVTGKANDARTGGERWDGTSENGGVPNQSAVVFSLRTGLPGPSMRGRSYWPVTVWSILSLKGELTTAQTTAFCNNFASALTGSQAGSSTHRWSVIHRGGVLGLTSTAITQVRVRSILGTQRRRVNKAVGDQHVATVL